MDSKEEYDEGKNKPLTREDIEKRVKDWETRIENIYSWVRRWANENDWAIQDIGPVPMDEEMMQAHDVPSRMLPTLKVEGRAGRYALFKPKALWVIGANGRIDLYTSKGVFIIVDQAERFEPPTWRIFRADDRIDGQPFDPSHLQELA